MEAAEQNIRRLFGVQAISHDLLHIRLVEAAKAAGLSATAGDFVREVEEIARKHNERELSFKMMPWIEMGEQLNQQPMVASEQNGAIMRTARCFLCNLKRLRE